MTGVWEQCPTEGYADCNLTVMTALRALVSMLDFCTDNMTRQVDYLWTEQGLAVSPCLQSSCKGMLTKCWLQLHIYRSGSSSLSNDSQLSRCQMLASSHPRSFPYGRTPDTLSRDLPLMFCVVFAMSMKIIIFRNHH